MVSWFKWEWKWGWFIEGRCMVELFYWVVRRDVD